MRESCSSGSVGGEGGNRLAYPAISCRQWRSCTTDEDDPEVVPLSNELAPLSYVRLL
jgi:hypothetical protein